MHRSLGSCAYRKPASPTKCGSSTRGESLASRVQRVRRQCAANFRAALWRHLWTRALRFRVRQARHLAPQAFVTHFYREDERPLIVHRGGYPSSDCLQHQKILQFAMAGSLAGVRHLHGICHACTHPRPTNARHASRTDGSAAPYLKRIAELAGRLAARILRRFMCA
jgi:hypothetical protein